MSHVLDAAAPGAAPRSNLFLSLAGGLAAILAGAAFWFIAASGLAFALLWALGGSSAVAALGAQLQGLSPALLARDADGATGLFFLACVLYACVAAGVVTYARLRAPPAREAMLAWRGIPRLRARDAWWLLPMAAYHALATTLVRWVSPDYAMNLFIPLEPAALILSFFAVVVLAPLAEELFFRGWLYGVLRARLSGVVAVLLCAAVFALAHWDGSGLYPLAVFLPGLALTLVRARTGSAQASAFVHSVYNCIGWAGLVVISAMR
jgi:membrane protease YdiL (CAAX protease family)